MRPIWTGTISFGLVSLPVQMFSATESKELRIHCLDKRDLQPIGYDKVRKDTAEHVEADEIIRGFEVDKARFVERKELLELLRANAKEPGDDRADAEVVDLMAALLESVEQTQRKKRMPAAKKNARKAS